MDSGQWLVVEAPDPVSAIEREVRGFFVRVREGERRFPPPGAPALPGERRLLTRG